MNYYMEFGGGLGDAFQTLYETGFSEALYHPNYMGDGDSITIAIISHNPHIAELFANHPKRSQMAILQLPYWMPEENERKRKQYALPPFADHAGYFLRPVMWKCGPGEVTFYPTKMDELEINSVIDLAQERPLVVFSVSAGLSERDFPAGLTNRIAVEVYQAGYQPVLVGRDYERFGRKEQEPQNLCLFSSVNALTVPGVAALVQRAAGVVCCHSAVNMLASYERKPQLLLYDEETRKRHFVERDQWSFMADYPEVFHGTFGDDIFTLTGCFLEALKNAVHS